MTPADVAFSRIIVGSEVAFVLLALAYFRLFGRRAKVAVARLFAVLFPFVCVASASAAIALDLPLVVKVLLWLPSAWGVFACLLVLIMSRFMRSALWTSPRK
jgi:hypothetical protein